MLPDTPRVRSRLDLLYAVTREFNVGLDLDLVLNRVLSATLATVGVADATLFLFDPQGELENFFLIEDFNIQKRELPNLQAVLNHGLINWVRERREIVLINDTAVDDRWGKKGGNHHFRSARSAAGVPIQLPDYLIGILVITSAQPNYFDQDDLAMLGILADQAAFAITNARLFKAEQRRRRLSDTFSSIARTINSTLNLSEVLDLILEQLALVIEYDSSSILLYDEDEETMSVRAGRRFDDMDDALQVRIPIVESSPNYQAIAQKKPVLIGDVDHVPGWIKSASTRKVHSWIGAPLIARNRVIGMLTVDSHQLNKYTQENADDMATFADYVATAVANAQVVTRLKGVEASYTALFDDSTDLVVITSYTGLILNVNRKACQLLRRTKDALIGGDIRFVHPDLRKYLGQQTRRLRAWREASLELDVQDAYRQTISLEFKIRQVHYGGRDCVQWVGRDISARKEAERLRQDLVNMLIHDLRGPIGNLINTIELLPILLSSATDMSTITRLLDLARHTGQEVRDLVDSLLDVSRLEKGEVPLQRTMVDVAALVQAVEKQVTPRAMAKATDLMFYPLPDIPPLWVDGSMIRRLLINLVDNAIKYTPSEGKVSLTTSLVDDTLIFAVADNGPGIRPEDQALIFGKFSRVDYSNDAPSGVGLGLAFCKLAAEAHNGAVLVRSEGMPGKGSTFTLTLPLITEPKESKKK